MNFETEYIDGTLEEILKLYPQARELKLSDGSSMGTTLGHPNGYTGWSTYPKHSRVNVTLITSNQGVVGWSWSWYKNRQIIFWTYIDPAFRRQGFGAALFGKARDEARRKHRAIRVERWNKSSRGFFNSLSAIQRPGY